MTKSISFNRFVVFICAILFFVCTSHGKVETIKTMKQYEKLVQSGNQMVVKYHADWCGACTLVEESFKELSQDKDLSDVLFVKVDVDQTPELAKQQGVGGIPMFVYISGKEKKGHTIGIENPSTFKQSMKSNIKKYFMKTGITDSNEKQLSVGGVWFTTKRYVKMFADKIWSMATSAFDSIRSLF